MTQQIAIGANQCLQLPWIEQIAHLPELWALCAVRKNKAPYHPDTPRGTGWQLAGLERERFSQLTGSFAAVGLILGPLSGGLIAIDHDGHSATAKIEELSGLPIDEALPLTVGFTSQREHRYQLLYWVPKDLWDAIKSKKIATGTPAEQVELRWKGLQSVILGAHPDTTGYRWLDRRSPWEVEVAKVPAWVIMAMRDETPDHVFEPRTEWKVERPLEVPIPLQNLTTKKHQDYIAQGVGEGGRNDAGAAIARDLIGCEEWAVQSGVYFEGTAEGLFWQFAQRSGLGEREAKTIWNSALRGSPSPSRSTERLSSVVKAWGQKSKPKVLPVKPETNGHAPKDEEPSIEERPSIEYFPDELPSVCDQVLGAISNGHDPLSRVYVQGGSAQVLTRILQHRERASVLEVLDHETLRNQINKKAKFYVTKKNSKGEYESPIECPGSVSKHILSDSRWPSLSEIKGLSNIPLLQSDGTVLNKKGYDPKSKYLLEINPDDFNILEAPTEVDAFNALEGLDNLISEFEFKGESDRSATLAMFLTAVSRKMYTTAPLFAVDANRPGVGKGTLVNMATSIVSGDKNAGTLITYSPDPEEFRKKVLSVLIDGLPCVNIDNIKEGELGGSTLEKILTDPSGSHKDRMLGASKTISVSTEVLWTANGNNIRLSKDMQRRSIVIKLFSSVANLGDRKFSRTDQQLSEYLEAERPRLVTAAITVLQAFLLANPQQDWPSPLPGFSAWDGLVRRALLWLGQPDPVAVQAEFEAMDDKSENLAFLLEAWYDLYGDHPISAKELLEDQGSCAGSQVNNAGKRKTLDEALIPFDRGKDGSRIDAGKFGFRLRGLNGSVAGEYQMTRHETPKGEPAQRKTGVKWVVKKI